MLSEPKGLNEECGVFGIWGNPNAASITHLGLQYAATSRARRGRNCRLN